MVATYPDDAVFNPNTFSAIGSVASFTNTGTNTAFNLTTSAGHRGEVLAIVDGVVQDISAYSLSNTNFTVDFVAPPGASTLTLQVIDVPSRLEKLQAFPTIFPTEFDNVSINTINGNNYIIDGTRVAWAVHDSAAPTSKNELLVTISGAVQAANSYTFPSTTLDTRGIDITPAVPGGDDSISIRVFESSPTVELTRCNDMSDKKPDRAILEEPKYDFTTFISQAGYEKTRLISRRKKRMWSFTYTNISGLEKEAIRTFYDQRSGGFETFIFDLTHINEPVGTAFVKFSGTISITQNHVIGTNELDKFYTVSMKFKEVFD